MKKITILGAGESGTGAAILAADRGYDVLVSDHGTIADRYKAVLEAEHIAWEEGTHSMERILSSDLVVKSPGIARDTPVMKAIDAAGIEVVSEIEFAGRYSNARMICITGSNGKTTTTLLTHHILTKAGIDAGLAGNVGRSLAWQVARDPHPVYVIELSSFQLDDMFDFKADIAVLLNITPDHLDRYDHRMENYTAAKFRILRNMTPADSFIYWLDDPVSREFMSHIEVVPARYAFADHETPGVTAWCDGDMMHVRARGAALDMPVAQLALRGIHNLYNSMAAATAALLSGVEASGVAASLGDFAAVEHRLEPVAVIDSVAYVNDSKATNVNSTFYALGAMTTPVVLILGGKDKGNDYSEILPPVKERVRAIVAMGLDNSKIIDFFKDTVPVTDTRSLAEAVEACRRLAHSGDTVLLSPCCASFDLFKSYEDRGRQFKDYVRKINGGLPPAAQ